MDYLWNKGGQSRDIIRWKEGGVANEAIMVKPNVNLWTVKKGGSIILEKILKNVQIKSKTFLKVSRDG